MAGVSTLRLPQVAGGLWWEEAAVVPVKLRGRDGQPRSPGAGEGGESIAMLVGRNACPQTLLVTRSVGCTCACTATSHLRSCLTPWGVRGFQNTRCLCCRVCACKMCPLHAHRPAPPCMYIADVLTTVGFAFHSTWTRTAPWGTCSGGSWMCQLVRLVSPCPFLQPTVP